MCVSSPADPSRITTAPSITFNDCSTSKVKSIWPGVSIILIWWFSQGIVTDAEVIVMPEKRFKSDNLFTSKIIRFFSTSDYITGNCASEMNKLETNIWINCSILYPHIKLDFFKYDPFMSKSMSIILKKSRTSIPFLFQIISDCVPMMDFSHMINFSRIVKHPFSRSRFTCIERFKYNLLAVLYSFRNEY